MSLKRLSHDHPLYLKELLKRDDDEEVIICYGCGQAIKEPERCYYSCRECNFFLHKACFELPLEITYPKHSRHTLILQAGSPYGADPASCDTCQEVIDRGFTYHCSKCHFDVCVACASFDLSFKHSGHQHQLMLQQRRASFVCDACLTNEEDSSYFCTVCPFWIHRSCASMPSIEERQDHNHPLTLAYSLPVEFHNFEYYCDVCSEFVHRSCWIYYCGPCRYFVHLRCMTIQPSSPSQVSKIEGGEADIESTANTLQELLQLPTDNFDKIIRQFSRRLGSEDDCECLHTHCYEQNKDDTDQLHLPILGDARKNTEKEEETICDCCIKPIASTFYNCSRCKNVFHLACAKLPLDIKHPCHSKHPLNLYKLSEDPIALVECDGCGYRSNGVFYKCQSCTFRLDVKCAALPSRFAHEAYMHPLSLVKNKRSDMKCNACGCSDPGLFFSCKACGYYLTYDCALLPKSFKHRWDKHPLILTYPPFSDHPDDFYCMACEKEIHPKYWLYHCRECDQSFHTYCPFKTRWDRNVKFGRTLDDDSFHPHPLVMIREANFHSSCNSCQKSLHDRISFACKSCQFYLCDQCRPQRF